MVILERISDFYDVGLTIFLPENVLRKFKQLTVGEVGMSTITYGELLYGAQRSKYRKKTVMLLEKITSYIPPLPIPTDAGKHYGEIRKSLEITGKPIGNNDLWIASHALALNVVLVSNNLREFARIPHLKIENWVGTEDVRPV